MVCAITSDISFITSYSEPRQDLRLALEEIDPLRHRQLGGARLGDGDDRVGYRRAQAPGRERRIHLGFGREPQDHLVTLGIRHHPLDHSFEDEELHHLLVALPGKAVSLAVFADREQGFERVPLLRPHVLQEQVFAQLQAQGIALRVAGDGAHAEPLIRLKKLDRSQGRREGRITIICASFRERFPWRPSNLKSPLPAARSSIPA